MKEKNIKFILELIFIFILPLCLLATCFKQEKVYDENNNEVGKYLTFDNIFVLSEEEITYFNYEYYDDDEIILLEQNETIMFNYNKNTIIHLLHINNTTNWYYLYYSYNGYNYYLDLETQAASRLYAMDIVYNDTNLTVVRNSSESIQIVCDTHNVVKNINIYTIGNNVVNRLLNYLYHSLGITSNWILQFIVIYTLLWLIMWFIWHILYLPLDFICSKLLFDRVDK